MGGAVRRYGVEELRTPEWIKASPKRTAGTKGMASSPFEGLGIGMD